MLRITAAIPLILHSFSFLIQLTLRDLILGIHIITPDFLVDLQCFLDLMELCLWLIFQVSLYKAESLFRILP